MKKFNEFNKINENDSSNIIEELKDKAFDIVSKCRHEITSIIEEHPELTDEEISDILPYGFDDILDDIRNFKKYPNGYAFKDDK